MYGEEGSGGVEVLPLIGISCAADVGEEEDLIPGRGLFFVPRDYATAIERAGGIPLLLPFFSDRKSLATALSVLDGLVISGGTRTRATRGQGLREQDPVRYAHDSLLVAWALSADLPLLGICRGHQMINEVMGGTTVWCRDETGHHQGDLPGDRPYHEISITAGTRLWKIAGGRERIMVNSFHRQRVARLGADLVVAARAPDGTVEAVESLCHHFVVGLQFHPESAPADPVMAEIFLAFLSAGREYRRRRRARVAGGLVRRRIFRPRVIGGGKADVKRRPR